MQIPGLDYCAKFKQSALARNTLWMFLGQGLRQLLRAVYFLIIPRSLGPEQYGAFVGVTSWVAILAPLATVGIGNLLVKHVSRDKRIFADYWGNSLFLCFASGSLLATVAVLVGRLVLGANIPWVLIALVAVSDLIFCKTLDIATQAFQAFDRLDKAAQINVISSAIRVLSALLLVIIEQRATVMLWGWYYLGSSVLSTVIVVLWVHKQLGKPKLALQRIAPELTEGLYFSVSLSSQTIYNDIDKTMMVQLSSLDAAGIYAAAYRLIDVAFLPVRSLLWATYPNFFRRGTNGIGATLRYAGRLLPRALGYSLVAMVGLFVAAPVLLHLLGAEYARTVSALRWLTPLLLFKTLHYFAADALTGADMQRLRTMIQIGVAIFNVLVNFWIIPAYSWRGAAWSSLASDGLLAAALWSAAFIFMRRQQAIEELTPSETLA